MKNELFVTAGEVAQELGVSAENIMKKNSTEWRRRV